MLEASKGGPTIIFTDWTTKVVNVEAGYKRKHKKESTKISSTFSGTGDNGRTTSGGSVKVKEWGANTGKPLNWCVNIIDMTILYGNVVKVSEFNFNTLPKITRGWFENNKNVRCSPHFKS